MSNLYSASKQWSERPADERYSSLQEMRDACHAYAQHAAQSVVRMNRLTIDVDPAGNDLLLTGPAGTPARLTHWSFGQVCGRVQAPADYLRTLPAPIAAQALSSGLAKIGNDGAEANALFHSNGSLVCRAFTSDSYARIWNYQVLDHLLTLRGNWTVPPARPSKEGMPGTRRATAADILPNQGDFSLAIREGDWIAPAGLYASDHDCFVFMVDESRRIDDGSGAGLARGFFVSNSEVGAAALKVTRFCYRHVCGNHIVWDAKHVQELRIVHSGANDQRFRGRLCNELWKYQHESAATEEGLIHAAKQKQIGQNRDQVIDVLFKAKVLPKKILEAAYDHAVEEADLRTAGSPRTAWGFAQGITHLSQSTDYADRRMELDRAAGKVLSIAF